MINKIARALPPSQNISSIVYQMLFGLTRIFTHSLIVEECACLTSSPRTSSISLFSLSPGPMCRSVKSSCRGNIFSICLEETAAEVIRALTAAPAEDDGDGEHAEAPRFRNLPLTFHAKRLLAVRCRHGPLGFADLARKSPQDLAQLCISAISLKEGSINLKRWLALCPLRALLLSPPIPAGISANS